MNNHLSTKLLIAIIQSKKKTDNPILIAEYIEQLFGREVQISYVEQHLINKNVEDGKEGNHRD